MSVGLFKSKQMRSNKNLKNLVISGPLTLEQPGYVKIITSSNPSSPGSGTESVSGSLPGLGLESPTNLNNDEHVVILVCKYDFIAEGENELSVKQNQFVKLVHKLGNGWVLVCDLEDKSIHGLVPASYFDIAINDPVNPITIGWLQQIDEVKIEKSKIQAFEIIAINQVFQNLKDKNFWYKIQFKIDHEFVYIGKTYHEFYDLHCKLLSLYSNPTILPKLPPPVFRTSYYHQQSSKFDKKLIEKLYKLANDLQEYMKCLLQVPNILIESTDLYEFIYNCPHVIKIQQPVSNEELIGKISPVSIVIEQLNNNNNNTHNSMTFSATQPLPPPTESSIIDKSSRIFRIPDQYLKYSSYINQLAPKHQTHSEISIISSSRNSSLGSNNNGLEDPNSSRSSDTTVEEEISDEKLITSKTNNTSRSSCNSCLLDSEPSTIETEGTSFDDSCKKEKEEPQEEQEQEQEQVVSHPVLKEISPPSITTTIHQSQIRIKSPRINSLQSESEPGESIFDRRMSNISQPTTPTTPMTLHSENFEKLLNSVISELDEFEFTSQGTTLPLKPKSKIITTSTTTTSTSTATGATATGATATSSSDLPRDICNGVIKIKVFLNNKNQDIIALKIKRSNLISLKYLKELISYKMYNDYTLFQHFNLLVRENQEEKMNDDELLQYIKDNTKVKLNLSRIRG